MRGVSEEGSKEGDTMSQPQPITTAITWHPGGAQRDSNGEGAKWPEWANVREIPKCLEGE